MPRNPIDETAYERALRLALGPRTMIDELDRREKICRDVIDPPVMRAIRESLNTSDEFDKQIKKALQPFGEAFTKFEKQLREITRASEAMQKSLGIVGLGSHLDEFQHHIKEATDPLGHLASDLERQQRSIVRAISGIDQRRWSELTAAAGALQENYRLWAEAGALSVEAASASMAVVRSLELVEVEEAPDPTAVAALVDALITLLIALARNTTKQIKELDIIQILLIVATIESLSPDYTAEDRQRDDQAFEIVRRIETNAKQVAAAQAAEEAWVNALPRAVVVGTGRVREDPVVTAEIRNKLAKGDAVAVVEKRDRWWRVIYRDQVTESLLQGWVWGGSMQELGSEGKDMQ